MTPQVPLTQEPRGLPTLQRWRPWHLNERHFPPFTLRFFLTQILIASPCQLRQVVPGGAQKTPSHTLKGETTNDHQHMNPPQHAHLDYLHPSCGWEYNGPIYYVCAASNARGTKDAVRSIS